MNTSLKVAGVVLLAAVAAAPAVADRGTTQYVYADVLDVKPLIRTVEVEIPVRECYERPVRREPRRASLGRTIAGGIIGGVIGSQIGDGSGRQAATIAGSVIGAAAANDRREETAHGRYCETTYEYETRERVDGFRSRMSTWARRS